MVGIDPAGPGRDRSVCIATAGGAIVGQMVSTAADASGDIINFLRSCGSRLRVVNVDSAGLGWYLLSLIRNGGFRCTGINVGSASREPERFTNLKAERYWHLRERLLKGTIWGLSDEMLAELASINYLIDPRGKTAIEDKASVKSALGRSPDLAEALMLALGEPSYEPFAWTPVSSPRLLRGSPINAWGGGSSGSTSDRNSENAIGRHVAAAEDRAARFARKRSRFSRNRHGSWRLY
jgi:hypothetical protein